MLNIKWDKRWKLINFTYLSSFESFPSDIKINHNAHIPHKEHKIKEQKGFSPRTLTNSTNDT